MGAVIKVAKWIFTNLAGIIGVLQALIKVVKELLTVIVNALSLFMPIEKAQAVVEKARLLCNKIDEWLEYIKNHLLPAQ